MTVNPQALKELANGYEKLFGVPVQNWSQAGSAVSVGLPTYNGGFKVLLRPKGAGVLALNKL